MNSVRMHIGVDVGKSSLDVCFPDGKKEHLNNNKPGRARIIHAAKKLGAIVCFEATGIYEEDLANECLAAEVRAARLDAWKTRQYAKSRGRIEKTDRLDSEMIRDFASSLEEGKLPFVKPRSAAHSLIKEYAKIRENLMKARVVVSSQLEFVRDKSARRNIIAIAERIEREIARLEDECGKAVDEDERMSSLSRRFLEVKGVGPCLVRAIFAECPDIGSFSKKGIAKFCGKAPIASKSCTVEKQSRMRRGRQGLRQAFHMAALSASKHNHVLRETYRRLIANGKPKMVALGAVGRHLAILLNNIAKYPDFKISHESEAGKRKLHATC